MINGILNIYKEKGYTSHDVVAKLRGIVGQKKIGHTGTLDPDAEGVLPVCLGRATKLCDMLTDKNKTYETILLLGKTTDTQDISGEVLKTGDTAALTEEQVKNCICGYIGEYDQLPPMYSALKVNGKKLYELAREGKEVERKTRKVQILDIQIKEVKLPRVRMEVSCSKGTYIRTLCHDIGEELGCGGCMEQLLRTRVSCFNLKDSLKLDEVRAYREQEKLAEILISIDEMFSDKKAAIVMKKFEALAYNGNELKMSMIKLKEEPKATEFVEGEQIRLYDQAQHLIGIFVYHENERKFVVEKMFLDQEELKK